MKIHSITNNTGSRGKAMNLGMPKLKRECEKKRDNLKQNNYDNINTSIKSNPDARVSFKGAPFLHKAANFASDNPLVAESLFALLITCGLRPLSIMATAKTEEDKEKCSYQAAKSISSGLVGLAMTAFVGNHVAAATKYANGKGVFNIPETIKENSIKIVNKGIEALKEVGESLLKSGKEPELTTQIQNLTENNKLNLKIFGKKSGSTIQQFLEKIKEAAPNIYETVSKALNEQKVLNNYARTGKNVADKLLQPIFLPLRASITIALIPVLLKTLGFQKPAGKKKEPQQDMFQALHNNVFKDDGSKKLFQAFAGVANHENT